MERSYGTRGACGPLKLKNESMVGESTIPVESPFKKFATILRLRYTNEASPSCLETAGV